MDQVVMHLEVELHQIANRIRVLRNLNAQRIFYCPHRGQRMGAGTDSADSFGECPRIARITPFEDHLESAPHRPGRDRVTDHTVVVDIDLDPHMAFDTGHGIDDDAPPRVVQLKTLRGCHLCH